MNPFFRYVFLTVFAMLAADIQAAPGPGFPETIVAENNASGDFPLVRNKHAAPLIVDQADFPGVLRAAADLQTDIGRVTGIKPSLEKEQAPNGSVAVIIGTLGKSALIDQLIKSGKITTDAIVGKWESFIIATVSDPLPGVPQALVIAGSDKRGTIYGIYEISEQIGISPWHWWADVPIRHSEAISIRSGTWVQGPPAVKYRGIFINDEEPALGPWSREKFGGVNSRMYPHMFELILRLRGNYLWPAMWGKAFSEDDPLDPKLADEYGIVMGTSHHEPMMRAQQEWTKRKAGIGNGEWNYLTNQEGLAKFWAEGMERNKDYDNLITIGMRGDGDEPMAKDGDMAENSALLERIVSDQRKMIAKAVNRDVTRVPQLWALYKEVADYYEHGMKVPDDVTLLWCDDNWGNVRRLPTAEERKRSGGAGIYYHFDYVGSPRSYKWINANPLPRIWEQMNTAFDYGADRIWIVNVGDLKPMELPIEFFLRMAWNPKAMPKEGIAAFTRRWAEREFGPAHADDIADIVSKYAKYNAWRKPELLEPTTYSLVNYLEAERVLDVWKDITARAEAIYEKLPTESRDAFYQLVLYPTKASAAVVELHIATGLNRLHASQGRTSANDDAERVRGLFALDQQLTDTFHQLNGGKWNHMMSQTHVGYTGWKDPDTNIMPELAEVKSAPTASMGVAVDGSENSWPGNESGAILPPFDSIDRQRSYIEVFKRGSVSFPFEVTASQPWVKLGATSGSTDHDQRIEVGIDWDQIPEGPQSSVITVTRTGGESVPVSLTAIRSAQHTRENHQAFGGLTGPTAIAAADAPQTIAAGDVRWERIPDYGRGSSGMAIFPSTAASVQPPRDSPRLEYPVFLSDAGDIRVDLITGPSLNFQPGRGVRIGVSFDDQPPLVIDAFAGQSFADPAKRPDLSAPPIKDWATWVKDNVRTLKSSHKIAAPGIHTLKIWMVDPGVVLEKLIVHTGDLRPSYFGPPESRMMDAGRD
ncbi:MAG: glycosyl hydrolase 115 family protein [Luteolibacter sp.]|uniref:glycosyl hydrolase 115 family protein n=1 Tax=Luteolibacter sp. TaxID=1962973 RepID=UPI003263ED8B